MKQVLHLFEMLYLDYEIVYTFSTIPKM